MFFMGKYDIGRESNAAFGAAITSGGKAMRLLMRILQPGEEVPVADVTSGERGVVVYDRTFRNERKGGM